MRYHHIMFTRSPWDAFGIVLTLVFFGALYLLSAERMRPTSEPRALLLDPSAEIQVGHEWLGLYFKGERAGFVHLDKQKRSDGGYRFNVETVLRMSSFGQEVELTVDLAAQLDALAELQRFDFELNAGPAKFGGQGQVVNGALALVIDTGGEQIERTIPLKDPPVLRSTIGPMLAKAQLVPGAQFQFRVFDPISQKDQDIKVEIIGPDRLVVFDSEVEVTRIRQTVSGLVLDGWLNHRGEMLRQELGLGLVAQRETEYQARSVLFQSTSAADLGDSTMITVQGVPPDLKERQVLSLILDGVNLDAYSLIDRRQNFDGRILSIRKESKSMGLAFPVAPQNDGRDPAPNTLNAAPLIQSDHPLIRAAALQAVGQSQDTVSAAKALIRWLNKHMTQAPVVGVPSALETLRSKTGDCNEHSHLFAALARSLGIPTTVVVGLVYLDGRFGYHAWNEIWTDSGWLSVDATWNQMPVDVGHVAFLRGGLSDQVRLLPVMGRLQIEVFSPR